MTMPRTINSWPTRALLRLIHVVERKCAYVQGKGYGTATIRREVNLVQKLLGRAPQLAVDIGGNIGDYTAELLKTTPSLEVHVFEPSALNIGKLRERFATQKNVTIVPSGVSNSTETATLYANRPGSGLGSLTKRNLAHFKIDFDHSETVSVIRFEDYWGRELRRRQIDIVKIDIEGHELAALKGFGEAIQSVAVLQFEFGGSNIDTRTFFQDFWYFFQKVDFDVYRITPLGLERIERYRETDETFLVTNFIAANRRTA
jgi:FkbM family methyltransferase